MSIHTHMSYVHIYVYLYVHIHAHIHIYKYVQKYTKKNTNTQKYAQTQTHVSYLFRITEQRCETAQLCCWTVVALLLQYCCSMLQCVAVASVCCCFESRSSAFRWRNCVLLQCFIVSCMVQYVAVYCSMLPCVAVCCNVLQCVVAVCCCSVLLQCIAPAVSSHEAATSNIATPSWGRCLPHDLQNDTEHVKRDEHFPKRHLRVPERDLCILNKRRTCT